MIMSIFNIERHKKRVKAFLAMSLLLGTSVAEAQIVIEGNVYGGGKLGVVTENTTVTMNDGTVGKVTYGWKHDTNHSQPQDTILHEKEAGRVFGGGMGNTTDPNTGRVNGNTTVVINGGHIQYNVYGGGELASVGLMDTENGDYVPRENTGLTRIEFNSGQVGPTPTDNIPCSIFGLDGYIFGGSKGLGSDPDDDYKDFANVNNTEIVVNMAMPANEEDSIHKRIWGSVYGGGEDGHVLGNTNVTYQSGLMGPDGSVLYGGNIYGGGRNFHSHWSTCGRVRGNTNIYISGGAMLGTVFGSGRAGATGVNVNGTMVEDDANGTYGHTFITMVGGKVGNPKIIGNSERTCGDIFGAGKGSLSDITFGEAKYTEIIIRDSIDGSDTLTRPTIYHSIYGGGELACVTKNTTVNISGGDIKHSVFGGGFGNNTLETAGLVYGNTLVNLSGGKVQHCVYGGGELANVGQANTANTGLAQVAISGGTIGIKNLYVDDEPASTDEGHVFGAGKGVSDDLYKNFCNVNNTKITVSGGKVYGTVYGGGADGHVLGNDSVFINTGATIGTSGITGYDGCVFGGGKGSGYITYESENDSTFHMYKTCGRVAGNNYVKIDGGTVKGSVYGGGRLALTGVDVKGDPSFKDPKDATRYDSISHGLAVVDVRGSSHIGIENTLALLNSFYSVGDIFGGGQGDLEYYDVPEAGCVANAIVKVTDNATVYCTVFGGGEIAGVGYMDNSHKFLAGTGATLDTIAGTATIGSTLEFDHTYQQDPSEWTMFDTVNNVRRLQHTCAGNVFGGSQGDAAPNYPNWIYLGHSRTAKVVVQDSPTIRSCVFGGAEQGTVTENTYVEIKGGTIGTTGITADSLKLVGDEWQIINTSTYNYGSVYGGGFGVDSIQSGVLKDAQPNFIAGRVYGNTYVDVSDGLICGNVYGGGNMASVGVQEFDDTPDGTRSQGKCFVTVSGGTIGDLDGTGMNANVFGGGRGFPVDSVAARNPYANVNSTEVTISGGAVKGSVYGGGAYSHVLDSTDVIITDDAVIGTTGFGRYDGSVFGGGRGNLFNRAAGRVAGNTQVVMDNGTVLGNLYGGGLVGLVGVDDTASFKSFINKVTNEYDSLYHGLTMVELSGGTIGNNRNDGLDLLRSNYKVGNVYGGGRGNIDEYREDDLGRAANAVVNITGSPIIYGSVFGGGQMANIGHWNDYDSWYTKNTSTTRVNIQGKPTIGTDAEFTDSDYLDAPGRYTYFDTIRYVNPETRDTTGLRLLSHTRTGNVYGGGQGDVVIDNVGAAGLEQGHCGMAYVYISETSTEIPTIMGSVFGGSEEGAVWGETEVHIAGGVIGRENLEADSLKYANGSWSPVNKVASYYYGSVFGGSYGKDYYTQMNGGAQRPTVIDSINNLAGRVYGNTLVDITGGIIHGNVYGGGDMASVGLWDANLVPMIDPVRPEFRGNVRVNVSGGTIGPLDGTGLNAYVFGGGKGFSHDVSGLRKTYCNVDSTFVTVSGGKIHGSIFGGGNDSHLLGSASIEVHAGADVGTNGLTTWDGNIFGGGRNFLNTNHSNGRVAGNIDITMDGGTLQGSIFGGGRLARSGVNENGVFPTTSWVPADHGNVTINVSGGEIGNDAHDGLDLLTLSDESVGDIFGSGKGDTKNYDDPLAGAVTSTDITITGSPRIHGAVFGGGEMASVGHWGSDGKFIDGTGSTTVTIGAEGHPEYNPTIGTYKEFDPAYLSEYPADEIWTIYEYDGENYTVTHTCTGNVFGGCQGDVDLKYRKWVSHARSKSSEVTIYSGTIMGGVFGGSEQGTVAGDTKVTVKGGTIGTIVNQGASNEYYFGNVYGAGYGSDDPDEDESPIANDSTASVTNATPLALAGRTYGNSEVDLLGGTVRGSVFGGSSYAMVGYGSHGNTTLNIGNASQSNYAVHGNFYGANNNNGTVMGDVEVYVNAGTIGNGTGVQSDVFGGGLGQYTAVNGDVTVTVDSLKNVVAPIIYGDVYGGSAFGSVNDASTDKTTVNIIAGSIRKTENKGTIYGGDVYGGGLGVSKDSDKGKTYGAITVNIGETYTLEGSQGQDSTAYRGYANIGNNVYGANNTGGSPQDDVNVNIFGTAHTADNLAEGGTEYAIDNVFGGGNYADYDPEGSGEYTASVNIFGCDNTVRRVFGGGDASASPNVSTDIQGGRFAQVFGGGNGELGPTYAANINGNVVLGIHGGEVGMSFGGSNQNGLISGTTTIVLDNNGPCGEVNVDEYFCGGNYVDVNHDINATITCADGMNVRSLYGGCNQANVNGSVHLIVQGGTYENVYGGSKGRLAGTNGETDPGKSADISGNILLEIQGGTIDTVFGGSNIKGNVEGKIIVTIDDAGSTDCPLIIHNVYGGGRNASYTPSVSGCYPEVNVLDGTISKKQKTDPNGDPVLDENDNPIYEGGNVFGGGFGSSAVVTTTSTYGPKVTIGGSTTSTDEAVVEGNVYGAGHGADVEGNTHVILNGKSVVDVQGDVFGGGKEAEVHGNTKVEVK